MPLQSTCHRIKAGTEPETAQASTKLHENVFGFFLHSFCHSAEIQSLLAAFLSSAFSVPEIFLSDGKQSRNQKLFLQFPMTAELDL